MKVKTPVLVGIVLLALGVSAFAFHGAKLLPLFGGIALAAGTVLVIVGKRKRPIF